MLSIIKKHNTEQGIDYVNQLQYTNRRGHKENKSNGTQIFTDYSNAVILRAKPEESQNRDSSLRSE
ncbi:MAG: hypothetical protein A2889_03460 [Nitrospinae bacterium RIFCSPLOWO2_01_FULL_39_10]|nr:MAG: hypothetical protein A2889_03460 [Nitrospinae bacterium RIFCSPLOWO2_01_FULL_39_10]